MRRVDLDQGALREIIDVELLSRFPRCSHEKSPGFIPRHRRDHLNGFTTPVSHNTRSLESLNHDTVSMHGALKSPTTAHRETGPLEKLWIIGPGLSNPTTMQLHAVVHRSGSLREDGERTRTVSDQVVGVDSPWVMP